MWLAFLPTWNIRHPGNRLVHAFIHVCVHRSCIQHPQLRGTLRSEVVCHTIYCEHLGMPVVMKKILVHCDNQAVVDIQKKGTAKCSEAMAIVCMLDFCAAQHTSPSKLILWVLTTLLVMPSSISRFTVSANSLWEQLPIQRPTFHG